MPRSTLAPHDTSVVVGSSQSCRGVFAMLDAGARARHLHIIGQTGTGKSTLLKSLLAQDLAAGRGLALIDPHGDLAQAVLAHVPTSRAHHVVYLDPSDLARPIGLNVIADVAPDDRAVVADNVLSAFIHIWGETSVGARSQQVLRNALRLLMDAPGTTLLCIPKLLTDLGYRQELLRTLTDPIVRSYWERQFAAYNDKRRSEVVDPLLNKVDAMLSVPAFRNIVGQVKSTIDVRRMMDEGRILIVNLSKGAIGEHTSHILGALLTTVITTAALSRVDTAEAERRPFYLYADEFQNFATSSFGVLLSEARKYGIALTLAHQHLGQLPEALRRDVLGNAASFVALRIGAEDSPLLSRHLGLEAFDVLCDQADRSAWLRTLINGMPTEPMPLEMLPPPAPINRRPHRVITNSRLRFGRERALVEDRIARFLAR